MHSSMRAAPHSYPSADAARRDRWLHWRNARGPIEGPLTSARLSAASAAGVGGPRGLTTRNGSVTRLAMDAVAQALADPIRREILRMLRDRAASAGSIAGAFPVSRPAVSRHLRVLREAGLVRDVQRGREREYRLELGALAELEAFLRELHAESPWHRRFDALETEVHRVGRQRRMATATPSSNEAKRKKETA
ncbi:ArsR/SmtB family transcription factor [Sorangium sp. So ce1078]|uniref:ArsR/SmtB family transcription factor n=1 Tax=Sorangium sp. So ce1078 TaxID=3133329 RepID=UPI003F60C125